VSILRLALILLGLLCAPAAFAHEVRPAYLEMTETAPGSFAVVWKQPVLDGRRLRLDPVFPETCTASPPRSEAVNATLVTRFTLLCALHAGEVRIAGLERTLTDVYVRIDRQNGDDISQLLKPASPALNLASATGAPVTDYVRIGIEHIVFGFDHLLFVIGLLLLVRPAQLIQTATAFTVAHSITLALSALAGISLPGAPVEILIAMSIALLAAEALWKERGFFTLSHRKPWLIAFGFGLVHGFGFAGALAEIGLPRGAEAVSLFLFNIGVEIGQLLIIAAALTFAFVLTRMKLPRLDVARTALAYCLGITGAYWAIERFYLMFMI
jgi:hypothetical protein